MDLEWCTVVYHRLWDKSPPFNTSKCVHQHTIKMLSKCMHPCACTCTTAKNINKGPSSKWWDLLTWTPMADQLWIKLCLIYSCSSITYVTLRKYKHWKKVRKLFFGKESRTKIIYPTKKEPWHISGIIRGRVFISWKHNVLFTFLSYRLSTRK